jgi:hypothetical protein
MSHPLPTKQPLDGHQVEASLQAVYNWNYEPELDQLRTLYANALEHQWIAMRDLDWDRELDREAFSRSFSLGGIPIQETKFWAHLPADTRWDVARKSAAFMLSNFLHGEQGAMLVASQLVNAVPHMDGKFYAATQTVDEARHVEVFAAYIKALDEVQPIAPSLQKLLDLVTINDDWKMKAVGMQIVIEGLALYTFRDMRNTTQEPLLKELLTYVSRDEARHTGYGIKYLSAVVPTLDAVEIEELEDFAFESARLLLDSRTGTTLRDSVVNLWREVGIEPQELFASLEKERDTIRAHVERRGGRRGAISGFVLPTMKAIGLFSERIQGHFQQMFEANHGPNVMTMDERVKDLPDDLEAWALSEN